MPRGLARVLATLGIFFAATLEIACGDPRSIRYDKGTFRFNWIRGEEAMQQRRRAFERQTDRGIDLLRVKMQDSAILDALRVANKRNRNMTTAQIEALDKRWRSSAEGLPEQLTDERCNESLKLFQGTFKGFPEISVTGRRGLNVCQTKNAKEYYQGNKEWWQRTFTLGKPRHAVPEFDKRFGVFTGAIYVPVRDPSSGRLIGIAKAIIVEERSPGR